MKTVSKEELVEKMNERKAVVINVLVKEAYNMIHIKGSISMPLREMQLGGLETLDKGMDMVVYCSSYDCEASKAGGEFLEAKGFRVWEYSGGMQEWAEAGLPTEGRVSASQYLASHGRRPVQRS